MGLIAWLLPSLWLQGHCSVFLSLSFVVVVDVCLHPLLEELQDPLVVRDFEQLHGALLVRGKATHLWIQSHTDLVHLVRRPLLGVCLSLLRFLATLWPLLRPQPQLPCSHGEAQSPGCCSRVAVAWKGYNLFFFNKHCFRQNIQKSVGSDTYVLAKKYMWEYVSSFFPSAYHSALNTCDIMSPFKELCSIMKGGNLGG